MLIRTLAILLLMLLPSGLVHAEDTPPVIKEKGAAVDARLQALNRSARDDGDLALKLYKYRRSLAKDKAFESNATVVEYIQERLDGISEQIRVIAERKKSSQAMYVHAHDLYSRGLTAETSPTPDGESSDRLYGESARWLKMSLSHPPSNVLLGHLYQDGKGVPRSGYAAINHYSAAGEQFLKRGETDRALSMLDLIESVDPSAPQAARLYTLIQTSGKTRPARRTGGMGTGFICGNGLAATAWHVVKDARSITLTLANGRTVPASIAAMDQGADIALLSADLPGSVPTLRIAESLPKPGSEVFTVGFPNPAVLGATPRVNVGRVSATRGLNDDPRTLQISVPVQPGNSGGPLMNMNGEVVGLVASTLSAAKMFRWTGAMPQNVNFAVKAELLEKLINYTKHKSAGSSRTSGKAADLENLVERVRPSVVLVTAK